MNISDKIKDLKNNFISDLKQADLESTSTDFIYNKYLGRKGLVNQVYPLLSNLSESDKPKFGSLINDLKKFITESLQLDENVSTQNTANSSIDISLPGNEKNIGTLHPTTIIINEIKAIFEKIGFSSIYGPEVDSEYYNFEALNIPD